MTIIQARNIFIWKQLGVGLFLDEVPDRRSGVATVGLLCAGAVLFLNGVMLTGRVDPKAAAIFSLFTAALPMLLLTGHFGYQAPRMIALAVFAVVVSGGLWPLACPRGTGAAVEAVPAGSGAPGACA